MFLEVEEAEFRADPDATLERIQSSCEAVVIKADGRIIAALVNPHLFEQVHRMGDRFEELRAKIADNFREFPEEARTAMIEALVREVRGEK